MTKFWSLLLIVGLHLLSIGTFAINVNPSPAINTKPATFINKVYSWHPLIYTKSPLRIDGEKGILEELSYKSKPIRTMITRGCHFTFLRFLNNNQDGSDGSSNWTGMLLQVYGEDGVPLAAHKFHDKSAFAYEDLKNYNMIEPLYHAHLKIAFAWTAKIDEVADTERNIQVKNHRTDVILYTMILPFDKCSNNQLIQSSPHHRQSSQQHSMRFQLTPLVGDRLVIDHAFQSQYFRIIPREISHRARYQPSPFRGLFVKEKTEYGEVFAPAMPSPSMRREELNDDVLIESELRNDFTSGLWERGPEDWMRLSFYQFKPLGQGMWKKSMNFALEVYLVNVVTGEEFFVERFRDKDAPKADNLDFHNTDPITKREDFHSRNKIGFHTLENFSKSKSPVFPPEIRGNLQVSSVSFKLPSNQHGDIVPYKFEKMPGRLYCYMLWIKVDARFDGRFQFEFRNVMRNIPLFKANSVLRATFTDDFAIVRRRLEDKKLPDIPEDYAVDDDVSILNASVARQLHTATACNGLRTPGPSECYASRAIPLLQVCSSSQLAIYCDQSTSSETQYPPSDQRPKYHNRIMHPHVPTNSLRNSSKIPYDPIFGHIKTPFTFLNVLVGAARPQSFKPISFVDDAVLGLAGAKQATSARSQWNEVTVLNSLDLAKAKISAKSKPADKPLGKPVSMNKNHLLDPADENSWTLEKPIKPILAYDDPDIDRFDDIFQRRYDMFRDKDEQTDEEQLEDEVASISTDDSVVSDDEEEVKDEGKWYN